MNDIEKNSSYSVNWKHIQSIYTFLSKLPEETNTELKDWRETHQNLMCCLTFRWGTMSVFCCVCIFFSTVSIH